MKVAFLITTAVFLATIEANAGLKVPNVFGNHMVIQRQLPVKVWGWTVPSQDVTVEMAGSSVTTQAGNDGGFEVFLPEMAAGGPYTLSIQADDRIVLEDVMVGEVWICSGQSNMKWSVKNSSDADLELLAAKHPNLRMISFPNVGSQEPVSTHSSTWEVCTPETVGTFSAVGYFFARQLHDTIDVPVGMINNAWGGSACEAWIPREVLDADEQYKSLMNRWRTIEQKFDSLSNRTDLTEEDAMNLQQLTQQMSGNQRPGNIYNGVLKSHLGYTIRGAIWYQGEANASRAYQYREMFPLMISQWRKEWGQGDFPFYWVQLADFRAEKREPVDSDWAELREAQTMTMSKLPNTGEAVIIDIGEGRDIHPRNKVDVGRRLARWALANQYGMNIAFRSPQYQAMVREENTIILSFAHVEPRDTAWRPFDTKQPRGFTIAGEDKVFVNADANILPDGRIEVSSSKVPNPVAVRYAWADNPVCNMYSATGLPLTPFRTDDWPGITSGGK